MKFITKALSIRCVKILRRKKCEIAQSEFDDKHEYLVIGLF